MYIGDNSKLFLESTELMRRTLEGLRKPIVWRTLCTLVALQEGSIAPHVRCLDPGSLLGFQLRVTSVLTLSAMGVPHGSL